MFLVNLTLAQFLAIFGSVSLGVLALYLWDKSRRRITVPTLRFWTASMRAAEVKHRKRIQQPWSLLLQLLGIALLLLALAQLRLGSAENAARDHVLVLDTSAWMGAKSKGHTLMDEARAIARAYVRTLPSTDRVMLVRADALATPATAFERNRQVVEDAIAASRAGATALNLDQAFEFARQARKLQGGHPGEIVYVGFGRTAQQPQQKSGPSDLRVLPVEAAISNCGLRSIAMRRSAADPDVWDILVAVQNYGGSPRTVSIALAFGESLAGTRIILAPPGKSETAAFEYRSRSAGWLEARIAPADDFDGDNRAVINVPARSVLKVMVYTDDPDLLRPVFASSPEVDSTFRSPGRYDPAAEADIIVLDRFGPPSPPLRNSIWIEPLAGSPVRMRGTVSAAPLTRWRNDHPVGAGLRTRDVRLDSARILQPGPGDIVIAECEQGPVIVARDARLKSVVLGFHPTRSGMKFELATPLLFANIVRWMQPDTFRHWELNARSAGNVSVELDSDADADVLDEAGRQVPHTRQDRMLRFFVGTPQTVRVVSGNTESVHSLVLPELAEPAWDVPKSAQRGLPAFASAGPNFIELWPWLASAGLLVLLAEWILYGRARAAAIRPASTSKKRRWRPAVTSLRGLL